LHPDRRRGHDEASFLVDSGHFPLEVPVARSSLIARVLVLSSLSVCTALVGCGGDDIPGGDVPQDDTGTFNDVITTRPDDGVDSAVSESGTDGGTDGGTDTLVAEGGDSSTTEGGSDAGETSADSGALVEITVGSAIGASTYSPSTANIKVGDTVKWTWAGVSHSVTSGTVAGITKSPDGKFDSGIHSAPFTFTFKFDTAGTYPYYCDIHGLAGMTGKVIVKP
jgi:plastocyanin